MFDLRRLVLVSALSLVACGSVASPPDFGPADRSYASLRAPLVPPARLDAQQPRMTEVRLRPSDVPETHRACASHRTAMC